MRCLGLLLFGCAGAVAMASNTSASAVLLNFNDLNTGALVPQGGGTGLASSGSGSVWTQGTNTSNLQVISGDLAAPASTHFSPTQGGTAQSIQSSNGTTSTNPGAYRTPASSLSGTIWFSFLLLPSADGFSREGIGINVSGNNSNPRILGVGSTLSINYGVSSQANTTSAFTLGTTALVIGELATATGSNGEELKIWVNPDTSTFASSTPTPTYDNLAAYNLTGGSITNLTAISYESGGNIAGGLDNILVSNDSNAESQALSGTLPEPATMAAILTLGAIGLLSRRRR